MSQDLLKEFDIEELTQPSPYCRCHPRAPERKFKGWPLMTQEVFSDPTLNDGKPFRRCKRCNGIVWQMIIKDGKAMSSGPKYTPPNSKPFVMPPLHPGQRALRKIIYEKRFTVVMIARRWGKALAIDTPIRTTTGWKTMENIVEGNVVYDENGKETNVVWASDVMHNRPCYKVCFNDGTHLIADEDHQWLTWTHTARRNHARSRTDKPREKQSYPQVRTTKEILNTLTYGKRGDKNHSIQLAKPLQMEETELPIHPYVLGIWLGDGTATHPNITTSDKDIIDRLNRLGYPTKKLVALNVYSLSGIGQEKTDFTHRLKQLNVLSNKHIPRLYLEASQQQRLELLKGLMDSDGYASRDSSKCEVTTTNKIIADDIYELVASLGMKVKVATLYDKDCGPKYRVVFTSKQSVFHLKRKRLIQHDGKFNNSNLHRMIIDVVPYQSVPVKCISVDSQNRLFLAGRNLIPTHNSFSGIQLMAEFSMLHPDAKIAWITTDVKHFKKVSFGPFCKYFEHIKLNTGEQLFRINRQDFTAINNVTGSEIYWLTAESPKGIQGLSLDLAVIDEAQSVPAKVWGDDESGESYLEPALSDRLGKCVFLGYPMGENWFTQLFFSAKHKMLGLYKDDDPEGFDADDWGAMHGSSWQNPLWPESEQRRVMTLPKVRLYNQYLAIPKAGGLGVFPNVDRRSEENPDGIIIPKYAPVPDYEGPFYMGVDLGREHDFTVCTLLDRRGHIVDIDRFNQMDWDAMNLRILQFYKKYNYPKMVVDESGSTDNPFSHMLKQQNVPYKPYKIHSSDKRSELIEKLSFACSQGVLTIHESVPHLDSMVKEMGSMKTELKDGKFKYKALWHDDVIMSLAMAWVLLNQHEVIIRLPEDIFGKPGDANKSLSQFLKNKDTTRSGYGFGRKGYGNVARSYGSGGLRRVPRHVR